MTEKNDANHNLLFENYELGFRKMRHPLFEATNWVLNYMHSQPGTKFPTVKNLGFLHLQTKRLYLK